MATIRRTPYQDDLSSVNLLGLAGLFSILVSKGVPTSLSMKNASSYLPTEPGELRHTPVDDTTRQFIKLEQSFLQQLDQQNFNFQDQRQYVLQEKMKISSELLLHCFPDAISLQLTEDKSIFYTIRKNNIHIYLQHYLIDEFDGTDEAIVSVYSGNDKLLDYGGTLAEAIAQLSIALAPESIALPELA
jgi:hypothetical protein